MSHGNLGSGSRGGTYWTLPHPSCDGSEGGKEQVNMSAGITNITEKHFLFVKGALTYSTLGILGGGGLPRELGRDGSAAFSKPPPQLHPKTLIEMWIICLDPVSANSEKGSGTEWAVRVGQRVPSRFGQSGAAREMNLVQIVVEAPATRGGLPST